MTDHCYGAALEMKRMAPVRHPLNNCHAAEPLRILRKREVAQRTGISVAHIYRLMRENRFPRSIRLGENSIGWLEAEIETWIRQRIAERDAAA